MKTNNTRGGGLTIESLTATPLTPSRRKRRLTISVLERRHSRYLVNGRPKGLDARVLIQQLRLLDEYRPEVSRDEAILLLGGLNPAHEYYDYEPSRLSQVIPDDIEEWLFYYGEKTYGRDYTRFFELVRKLRQMTTLQLCSLVSSVYQWWSAPDDERWPELYFKLTGYADSTLSHPHEEFIAMLNERITSLPVNETNDEACAEGED
jgi:hypothetical protein